MGKGDKKTKRGKIAKGSYGNNRPHNNRKKVVLAEEKEVAAKPAKKK